MFRISPESAIGTVSVGLLIDDILGREMSLHAVSSTWFMATPKPFRTDGQAMTLVPPSVGRSKSTHHVTESWINAPGGGLANRYKVTISSRLSSA